MIRSKQKYIFKPTSRGLGLRRTLLPIGLLGICIVLAFQAWMGPRGLGNLIDMRQLSINKQLEIDGILSANATMFDRVKRLQLDGLDLDYLDERARTELGMVHPDDKILPTMPMKNGR